MKEITRRTMCCGRRKEWGQSERGNRARIIRRVEISYHSVWPVWWRPHRHSSTERKCHQFLHRAPLNTHLLTFYMTNSEQKKIIWETRKEKNKSQNRHFAYIWAEKNSHRPTIFSNWNRKKKKRDRLIQNGKSNARNSAIVGSRETGSRKGGRGQKT